MSSGDGIFKNKQAVYTANTLLACYLDIMFGELENLEEMNSPYISIKHLKNFVNIIF